LFCEKMSLRIHRKKEKERKERHGLLSQSPTSLPTNINTLTEDGDVVVVSATPLHSQEENSEKEKEQTTAATTKEESNVHTNQTPPASPTRTRMRFKQAASLVRAMNRMSSLASDSSSSSSLTSTSGEHVVWRESNSANPIEQIRSRGRARSHSHSSLERPAFLERTFAGDDDGRGHGHTHNHGVRHSLSPPPDRRNLTPVSLDDLPIDDSVAALSSRSPSPTQQLHGAGESMSMASDDDVNEALSRLEAHTAAALRFAGAKFSAHVAAASQRMTATLRLRVDRHGSRERDVESRLSDASNKLRECIERYETTSAPRIDALLERSNAVVAQLHWPITLLDPILGLFVFLYFLSH
jgi:hypothetical protein